MKIRKIEQLDDFLAAVDKCVGDVYLESVQGDRYNLKSQLNKYIALGALLTDKSEMLELFCDKKEDEKHFLKFFYEHPEVL